jgi:hypothetical protein
MMARGKMMWLVLGLCAAALVGASALALLRLADRRAETSAASALSEPSAIAPAVFDPAMVAHLPDPARRYFLYAIEPGAPLKTSVELEMDGQLSLGSREKPDYMPMQASQVLRLDGFVWRVRAGSGPMWFEGSDGYLEGQGWTRFWLYGAIPIVRAAGGDDIARSAAGRAVAEALFWVPAALLPSARVRWEPVDADTARAVVAFDGHEHRVELTVAPDGRPTAVLLMRWSRENPERVWRLQPFGGTIGAMRQAGGYRVAAAVDGGNGFGTEDYFPFYKARVTAVRFH